MYTAWDSLTDEVLSQTYARYESRVWDLAPLFFPDWEERIRGDAASTRGSPVFRLAIVPGPSTMRPAPR